MLPTSGVAFARAQCYYSPYVSHTRTLAHNWQQELDRVNAPLGTFLLSNLGVLTLLTKKSSEHPSYGVPDWIFGAIRPIRSQGGMDYTINTSLIPLLNETDSGI